MSANDPIVPEGAENLNLALRLLAKMIASDILQHQTANGHFAISPEINKKVGGGNEIKRRPSVIENKI